MTRPATENPTPTEWRELPPDTPYGGQNRYAGLEWSSGEKVTNLATPSRRRPHEGQLWVGSVATGYPVRKATARDRVRRQRERQADNRCDCELPDATTAAAVLYELEGARRSRSHIPTPPGVEFPHRPGKGLGCRYHRTWLELGAEVQGYREDGYAEEEIAEALRASPRWQLWHEQETRALDELRRRLDRKKPSRKSSAQQDTLRRKRAYVRAGGDVTDVAWTETLRAAEKKRAKKYGTTTFRANPTPRFYWCGGGYCCDHNHPTVEAAIRCAAQFVTGTVEIRPR
jgi:hypothetical protein